MALGRRLVGKSLVPLARKNAPAQVSDFSLSDDGTMDTVIELPDGTEARYDAETASDYRDPDTGELDLEKFVEEVVLPDWEAGYIGGDGEEASAGSAVRDRSVVVPVRKAAPPSASERSEQGICDALDRVSECAAAAQHYYTSGDADEANSALDDLIAEAKACKQRMAQHGENFPAEAADAEEETERRARISKRAYSTTSEGDTAPLRKAMDDIYGAGQALAQYDGPGDADQIKEWSQQAIDLANDIEAHADEVDEASGDGERKARVQHRSAALVRKGMSLEELTTNAVECFDSASSYAEEQDWENAKEQAQLGIKACEDADALEAEDEGD